MSYQKAMSYIINSLDKSKVINYSEGIISDIDIKKSIVELQDSLTEYSNELKQTEDYFTEINKAIVDEKIILNSKEKILALILPWHFRETFLNSTLSFRRNGNLILFPIPDIEII
jgi:hypothetical protein